MKDTTQGVLHSHIQANGDLVPKFTSFTNCIQGVSEKTTETVSVIVPQLLSNSRNEDIFNSQFL